MRQATRRSKPAQKWMGTAVQQGLRRAATGSVGLVHERAPECHGGGNILQPGQVLEAGQ